MLDVYSHIARLVREGDAEDLNERQQRVFSHVVIDSVDDGVNVTPVFRADVVERYADPSGVLRRITTHALADVLGGYKAGYYGDPPPDRPPATSIHIDSDALG